MTKIFISQAQARETFKCPMARTFAEKVGQNCDAANCILWRWKPAMASDPEFMAAIKREMIFLAKEHEDATGKKKDHSSFPKEAVARVMRNPSGFGVEPEEGYCGLGGVPT
ncbi:MAG: hypothetical protein EP341_03790 [Sphingomonadales bacterium]|nr:MAG: hypothetical protein EP341_03790 [Sphingomonadales bacterium]